MRWRRRKPPPARPPMNVQEEFAQFVFMWHWQAKGMRMLAAKIREDWPDIDRQTGIAVDLGVVADLIEENLPERSA